MQFNNFVDSKYSLQHHSPHVKHNVRIMTTELIFILCIEKRWVCKNNEQISWKTQGPKFSQLITTNLKDLHRWSNDWANIYINDTCSTFSCATLQITSNGRTQRLIEISCLSITAKIFPFFHCFQNTSLQHSEIYDKIILNNFSDSSQVNAYSSLSVLNSDRRHTCCSLPWPSSHLRQKVRNKRCADSVQYSQTFFPSAIRLWNTLLVDICQLSPDSFKTHLNSVHFIWAPVCILFLSSALHCFYPKLLFIVCRTAFSIHICLFTRGAILLGIESAPLSEDDEDDHGF